MTGGLRKAVFFALVIGLVIVGYQCMIKPANKNLADAKARVDMKLAKLGEYEKATAAAEDLSKQLVQLEEAIAFFESRLPPESKIHEVLEQVTVIAQKEGLHPKTIRTLVKKNSSGYVEQPLRMELEGNFKRVIMNHILAGVHAKTLEGTSKSAGNLPLELVEYHVKQLDNLSATRRLATKCKAAAVQYRKAHKKLAASVKKKQTLKERIEELRVLIDELRVARKLMKKITN